MKTASTIIASGLIGLAASLSPASADVSAVAGSDDQVFLQVAQTGGAMAPGMLTTQAFKKIPEGETITVTPYDDNDLNLQLKTEFETELTADERTVAEAETGLLLLFEAKVVPAEQAPRRPSLGSVRASAGQERDLTREDEDNVEVEANVNVWSNTQDSVLGGRQEAEDLGASVFHINAVLRNQANGEVLWQGDAYYELLTPDTERVARGMVPPLVDRLGSTTANEPFETQ